MTVSVFTTVYSSLLYEGNIFSEILKKEYFLAFLTL